MARRTPLPKWVRIVRERPSTAERTAWHQYFGERPACRRPQDVVELLAPRLEAEEQEIFVVVILDSQHRVVALCEVTRGIINSSLVHPREVFRIAIAHGAAALVLAHNHPSGDPTPSSDDRVVTEQLIAAGKLLDIPVHDHVIIGCGRYVSFAEAGLL